MSQKVKTTQAPCNECGRETEHVILKTQSKIDKDEEYGAWWETSHSMIECRGCHFISLERSVASSEYQELEVEYFPPPISRRMPKWATDNSDEVGPRGLSGLLKEVYSALHANNRRLATMGARTLLDMVILDQVGDVGSFKEKLNAIQTKGLIGSQHRIFLEAALNAGHAAAHRGHLPSAENLDHVMDIVENVIAQVYILPEAAKKLQKATPNRKLKR